MSSEKTSTFSEPSYAKSDKAKTDYPWYSPNIDKYLVPETQKLLEAYSNIPRDKQSEHVHEIRDQAWAIRSYPCTGLGVWLVPFISTLPAYPTILKRLKDTANGGSGARLIDIGCFLGSDLRRLAFDGAPTENLYGVDIVSHWDVGFALYRDQDKFKAHFIEADLLSIGEDNNAGSGETTRFQALRATADIVSISAVLHQWDWDDQIKAAKKVVALTKGPDALVVGHQIGNVEAKQVWNKALQVHHWRHTPESFAKLWDQVGAETGTAWKTEGKLLSFEEMGWDPEDNRWMEPGDKALNFVVTRLK
ncbi:hypothetical protein TCE0_041r13910 [Talaromyces pinophilus]|uniref:Methyltransferase domain-containing protein n=1 Tax=Talaromyces pinophilus TaxID=128442 RepID=A0A6V8HHF0_TALPI|nr:hypothetical protein TCE0_041r13910 [Talaromyces pinophilus]